MARDENADVGSADPGKVARQILSDLITEHGPGLCDDPRRCESLLQDLCPSRQRDIHVLMAAVRERIPTDLRSPDAQLSLQMVIDRLIKRLVDNRGLTTDVARWSVETWALALDIITKNDLTASPPSAISEALLDSVAKSQSDTVPGIPAAPQRAKRPQTTGQGGAPGQSRKVTISLDKKTQLIARVTSGELSAQQAAAAYGIPEAMVHKWVPVKPKTSTMPKPPAVQGSSTKSTLPATSQPPAVQDSLNKSTVRAPSRQPTKVAISLEKKTELIAKVSCGELSAQQAAAAYGVPEAIIDKWVPMKPKTETPPTPRVGPSTPPVQPPSNQPRKLAISLTTKVELVARVTSGELSSQQAAAVYGVPETIIDKWVPAISKTGPIPTPPPAQGPGARTRKVTVSLNVKDELIARVNSGELSVQQAAAEYGIPEKFVSKWVSASPPGAGPIIIPLPETLIIGGDSNICQHVLDGAHVSPQHARIDCVNDQFFVTNLSNQGTYLNGAPIQGKVPLKPGDILNIGSYRLLFDGSTVITQTTASKAEIICSNLTKEVTDRSSGEKICILNDISLLFQPCEFTVIIGPSGGGKSTLLNALSGRNPATSGEVLVNGQNLYTHFDALKQHMALVPQKDALHGGLRVRKALLYTAKLRLPADTDASTYESIVDEYLETVSLQDRPETHIKNLSGGQVKRASLANEIISQPNLLFVDEATSGLDEHTDAEIMKIFREIAEAGKTVVCITHNLNNVERYCHKVIILANGGYLVFAGTVEEATNYFNVDRLGDVYEQLLEKPATDWRDDFSRTPAYLEMDAQVQLQTDHVATDVVQRKPETFADKTANFFRQLPLLSKRGWEIQLSDLKSMAVMGIQCIFVGVLICMVAQEYPLAEDGLQGAELIAKRGEQATFAGRTIFLLVVSSFWFGCNNAAKEIVKEKEIYERERDVCLNVGSYYTAKFLMLAVITTAQVLLLLFMVNFYTGLPGSFPAQLFSITIIGICGVSTGLLISAISKNEDMAVTLVPVAIIPQVILAGLIFKLEGLAEYVSKCFISCYWGYGNAMASIPKEVSEVVEYDDWTYLSGGVVILHIVLLIAIANAILYAADKRLSLKGSGIDTWLKKQG